LIAYPNPFSEQTTIKFTLEKRQFVSVSIFNVSGTLVKNIYSNQLDQGTHEFQINASQLASGIYFCKIKTEDSSFKSELKLVKH